MEEDKFDINGMTKTLFGLYEIVKKYKECGEPLCDDSLIKKVEVYALLFAARIDVTICLKNIIESKKSKYERCFFLNIAYMKMREIMMSLMDIITKTDNPLYFNPCTKKEIVRIINEWKKQFDKWIKIKRNHSTAHYPSDFFKYIDAGYLEVNPVKNDECFTAFYKALEEILENMGYIKEDIKKFIKKG